jgi:hypothetical protein
MEFLGGLLVAFGALVLLAGVGLAALLALASMVVLHFLTEMSFKKVFLVSAAIGLLAPIFVGAAIGGAVADGSFERDIRSELGDVIQLPEDAGENWRQALPQLREVGEASERGELTEEEAEARVREIFSQVEGFQISFDSDGDGIVISNEGEGVQLELPAPAEVAEPASSPDE